MLRDAYEKGRQSAYARFKVAGMLGSASVNNPALAPSAVTFGAAQPPTAAKPAVPPATPMAAHAAKTNVLG